MLGKCGIGGGRALHTSRRMRGLRRAAIEALELRRLLSVTAAEYSQICSTYPDFGLPANMAQVNIIEIAAGQLSVANLRSAITTAGTTSQPDLVVVRTTDAQNTITYASAADRLAIDIPAAKGAISIVGFGSRSLTLDAASKCGVVLIGSINSSTTVNLGGMVLTRGVVTGTFNGGGISQSYGTLRLENVTINGNTASSRGGGVYQSSGTLTLTNATISGNTASYGGGVYQDFGGTLTLTNVTISGNTASSSGGGVELFATSTLTNATISGNAAGYTGGGVYQAGGNVLTLTNVAIGGNASSNGGGVYQDGGTLTLTNVTISGNTASSSGGGAELFGTSTFTNVTISTNTAWSQGGGVYEAPTASLTLRNTIVARNVAGTSADLYQYGGAVDGASSLIGDGTGQTALVNGVNGNLVGTSSSPIDPKLAEGTTAGIGLSPLSGSPAIDAGDNSLIPTGITTDVYGAARIQGAKVNIGAVETVLPWMAGVTYVVTSLDDTVAADGVLTLREALAAANSNRAMGDAPAGSYAAPDRIEFAPGLTGTIGTHGQPYQIVGSIDLVGPGAGLLMLDAGGNGGVVDIRGPYAVSISGLTLTGGNAVNGGGIYAWGTCLFLDQLAISANVASSNGGALYGSNCTLILTNVTISANTASSSGGGLYQDYGSTSTLTNVAISGNTALSSGGGVYLYYGTSTLTNVTIWGNTASSGGGVYEYYTSSLTLRNTIVAKNVAGTSADLYLYSGATLAGVSSLIADGTGQTALVNGVNGNLVGTSSTPIDPLLAEGSSAGVGLSPLPGSPAIDAGDNSLIPAGIATDIYGAARIQGAKVNIGAVETVLPWMAGVTYVVTSLNDSTVADGVLTLREALAAANSNQAVGDAPAGSYSSPDRIEFAPRLLGTILTSGQPYRITSSITLVGPGTGQLTVDAKGSGGVVDVRGPYAVSISGLTLTGGNAVSGGGIYAWGTHLSLDQLVISANTASSTGGGVYQSYGTSVLTNVTISANTAASSGGGLYQSYGASSLTNVTINGNKASSSFGGGMYQSYGTSSLTNVTINGNRASSSSGGGMYQYYGASALASVTMSGNTSYSGGGAYLSHGTSVLTNVVISGNTASYGGAVYLDSGVSALTNMVISGNAASSGGGVYLYYATSTLTNVTTSGNTAYSSGGGAYLLAGTARLKNTIVARNTSGSGPDLYQFNAVLSGANTLVGNGVGQTSLVNGVSGNLVGTAGSPIDPGFVSMTGTDWTQWNLRLQVPSPAINSGDNAWIPAGVTTDLDGRPRIVGGTVDMGAYEYSPPPTVVGFWVNDGSVQRSMVNKLVVTFSMKVTLTGSPISVVQRNGNVIPNVAVSISNPSGDQTTWVMTFSGTGMQNGSLPDGTYKLVISAAGVSDLAGNPMAGDYRARFYRLFGDSDGDRVVSRSDLVAMRNALSQPAVAATWFDYDGNGTIDMYDLRQLRVRLRRALL